jgi:hypothetical protein
MKALARHLLGLALLGALPVACGASTLIFDDFNSENGGGAALTYGTFANWDVIGGTVDLQGNGVADNYPGFGLYVDMDGSNALGTLRSKQLFSLSPGQYTLQFDIGNNPSPDFGAPRGDNSMNVSLGALYSETFQRNGVVPMETIQRQINVPSGQSAYLIFSELGVPDSYGVIIDNVLLEDGVPEPASFALAGGSLAFLLLLRKRR